MGLYLKHKYPLAVTFCQALAPYNIGNIREKLNIVGLAACLTTPAPTLVDISKTYDRSVAKAYLKLYILDLCKSINTRDTMDKGQINQLATLLYQEAQSESIYVIHEFFRRCLSGYYGEYYGSIDCVKVMCDYRQFRNDFSEIYRLKYQQIQKINAEYNQKIIDICKQNKLLGTDSPTFSPTCVEVIKAK